MKHLTFEQVRDLVQAAVNSGLILRPRPLLFRDIPQTFVGILALDTRPLDQFRLDVGAMNQVERLEDGTVPLAVYLRNAGELVAELPEAIVFRKYSNQVTNYTSGVKDLKTLTALPAEVSSKEAILFHDDTVDVAFVEGCLRTARSVARLTVPRFGGGVQSKLPNGMPLLYTGTCWLLSSELVMTNHHVVNARGDGEASAGQVDFALQGSNAVAEFDYDGEGPETKRVAMQLAAVEAVDEELDFCVLRLTVPIDRSGLPVAASAIEIKATTTLALNVVQHPQGKAKRFAIRNNLAVDADAKLVRYYTDTDRGSSGSPVCDDDWRVVALHRGAMLHGAKFQGKETAFVNVGSQMARIVERLRTTNKGICDELGL